MKRHLDYILRSHRVDILLEDDALLIVNKPAGMLVIPDRYHHHLPNLAGILHTELGKVFIVHRLDRDTSGVVVFAKTAEFHRALSLQFEERNVRKVYQAIVLGRPPSVEGRVDVPLSTDRGRPGAMRVDRKRGKPSTTSFRVLEQFEGFALMELVPATGRTHQLRIHMHELGTPILADPVYGNGKPFFLSSVKPRYKEAGEERPLLARTALHACELTFTHPLSKTATAIREPLPKDMASVVKYLKKFRPS